MRDDDDKSWPSERWASFKFSVVGQLLAAPPAPSELRTALEELAEREWLHPITGEPTRFAFATIERWYYQARRAKLDPVGALRRKVRSDRGHHRVIALPLREALRRQHHEHPSWSYQLHYDNLVSLAKADATLGPVPSYETMRRFMKAHGLLRRRRVRSREMPDGARAPHPHEPREVRSYEAEHVNGLWHADFHHGSLPVLLPSGRWGRPIALGILDDRSRLACHVQWYLSESAQTFTHGLSQAFQKRALPRSLMTDNGAAMLAAETREGLRRLGVVHQTTLPYSPHQNGKQESFWGQLEGRCVAMLEGCRDLSLDLLNQTTQAWCELEYNRKIHSEIATTPVARYLAGPDLGRPSPASDALRQAFTTEQSRTQRHSDGTLSLEGQRFEVPSRFRHLPRLRLRFARWDLTRVVLVDPSTATVLERLYPLDRGRNADGRRRRLPESETMPTPAAPTGGIAPLLQQLLSEHAATGLPPNYVPLDEPEDEKENS